LRWTKPGSRFYPAVNFWTLSLGLVTTGHKKIGTISVHRLYSQRDLQLDINLLTAHFPMILADALQRMIAAEKVEIEKLQLIPAMAAASGD
jgi:hypothetical protein